MLVLLIWPNIPGAVLSNELSCCEPLPLEYLAGGLQPAHDVMIHDMRLDGSLADLARTVRPDLVGIAVPYTTAVRASREVSRTVRRLWPNIPIVIGGHHPSVTSDWLDGFSADWVVVGEAALAFRELVDQLERGKSIDVPAALPFSERRRQSKRTVPASLDAFPFPDRSTLARHRQHYFHSIYKPVALMRFSVGCPFACTFCSLWKATDRQYVTKSIDRVVEELSGIDSRYIYVVDDEAFIQSERMRLLAARISESRIDRRYHMYVRADTVLRDRATIEAWADVGLDSVLVGAESMIDDELDRYDKRLRADQTAEAVRFLHSLGVKIRTNFIINPDFSRDDFRRVGDTVERLGIELPSFSVLTPLPGTDLFDRTRDTLISDNPDLFDCYHTLFRTKLPLEVFYMEFAQLIERTANANRDRQTDAPVFYYSHNNAFGRMVSAIRSGHELNSRTWSGEDVVTIHV